MSLNHRQLKDLDVAIAAYAFPKVYFDFGKSREVKAPDMRAVETASGGASGFSRKVRR